jgi:hypothetical protein
MSWLRFFNDFSIEACDTGIDERVAKCDYRVS